MDQSPAGRLVKWGHLSPRGRALVKLRCEEDHLSFTRVFFQERKDEPFKVGPHHRLIGQVIDDVLAGRRTRVIINVPPGYTKTEEAVIALVARGLALNPRARFIHASFNGELVNENSQAVKDTIATEAFQANWPTAIRDDVDAKGLWRTVQGGGMLAKPAGGPITGFRAGTMEHGFDPITGKFNFTGALIIDDALKPDDAFTVEREKVNNRWHTTFKSRLAVESVPVIVIMQRLHPDDFSGFLLKGGSGEVWDHLNLPVLIDNAEEHPVEWTHGRPIPHGLPDGPLWEEKHTLAQIEVLKRASAYTYNSQYRQRPSAAGGVLFKTEYLQQRWHELPRLLWRRIYVDTAQKAGQRNDWTVLQCWGAGADRKAYLIDQVRAKIEAPELLPMALAFWNKHRDAKAWPTHLFGTCRGVSVEDKVSGTGLIQSLRKGLIPVTAIQRDKDKWQRGNDVVPHFAVGAVVLPREAPWIGGYVAEMEQFDGSETGHDDQVDPTMDAVAEICGGPAALGAWVG